MRALSFRFIGVAVITACAVYGAGCSGSVSQVPATVTGPPSFAARPDIRVVPSSLTVEAGKSTAITIRQKNYRGKFHSVGSRQPCKSVAAWSPHRGRGPKLKVTVKGVAAGFCTFGFTNAAGRSVAWVRVTVQPTPSPSPTPPNVKYYAVPASSGGAKNPFGITVGSDKNLWFTLGSAIGRMSTTGAVTLFTKGIPVSSGLKGIATGSDGDVWFTGNFGVGRITTTGAVTKYASSYSSFTANGIASGPADSLSVSGCDSTNNLCGAYRLTTDGNVTFVGQACDSPADFPVAPGPHDTVWLGGYSCVKEFGALYSGSWTVAAGTQVVTCITQGPDGNEWFGTGAGAEIGKITPVGSVTSYNAGIPAAAGGDWLGAIASGPDGNLWFTAANEDTAETYVGRVTTGGTVTLYGMGAHGMPGGLTFGPDGAIWFTVPGAIGRTPLPPA